MNARIHMNQQNLYIELVAENKRETVILRILCDGIAHDSRDRRILVSSFGYDRKMPRRKAQKEGTLQSWAERQVLTFQPTAEATDFVLDKLWRSGVLKKDVIEFHGRRVTTDTCKES